MKLTVDELDGIGVVRIPDDITMDNLQQFADFFRNEINPRFAKVILDMSEVDYFCSSAYGVMIRCLEATRSRNGDMVLANVSESVRRLFEVTRLTSVIRLEQNEETAVKFLNKLDE